MHLDNLEWIFLLQPSKYKDYELYPWYSMVTPEGASRMRNLIFNCFLNAGKGSKLFEFGSEIPDFGQKLSNPPVDTHMRTHIQSAYIEMKFLIISFHFVQETIKN